MNSKQENSNNLVMVKIHGLSFFEGHGVGRAEDGKVYFVDEGCPGDIVYVEPYKETKAYSFAKIVKFLEHSKNRVSPACEVFERCGGCSIQHVSYETQIEFKQQTLERYTSKKNASRQLLDQDPILLRPFETCDKIYGYRDRTEVHVENGKWGFYEKKSHNLVFPKTCKVLNPLVNLQLETPIDKDGHYHADKNGVQSRSRGTNGVFDQINPEINLKLKNYLFLKVQGFSNEISQVYDLYAGSGNYSLFLTEQMPELSFVAVELSQTLISVGKKKCSEGQRVKWICSDVEKFLASSRITNPQESLIIVNPPRDGLQKAVVTALNQIKPNHLIYISCNPMTLFRDIDALSPSLRLRELKGFDMFPQTMHFESLAVLCS